MPSATAAAAAVATPANANKKSKTSSASTPSASQGLSEGFRLTFALYAVYVIIRTAYRIRLFAIEEFGPVIHEFDPWFNYRATEVRTTNCVLVRRT